MGQLKEADFLRWGNTKRMTGLRKAEQDGMWEGIKERSSSFVFTQTPKPPPPPLSTCRNSERTSADMGYFLSPLPFPTLQIISMTTGAWHRRSPQPLYQRNRDPCRVRNHRCTPVPRPRTRRALRTETAHITFAVCQSDCTYPKDPCFRILHRPFSKMVRYRTSFDSGAMPHGIWHVGPNSPVRLTCAPPPRAPRT